jgi:hypothetical protein
VTRDAAVWGALSAREHAHVTRLLPAPQRARGASDDDHAAAALQRFALGRALSCLDAVAWRDARAAPACRARVPPPREGSAAAVLCGACALPAAPSTPRALVAPRGPVTLTALSAHSTTPVHTPPQVHTLMQRMALRAAPHRRAVHRGWLDDDGARL